MQTDGCTRRIWCVHNLQRNALAPQQDARVPFSQGIVRDLLYMQLT